MSRKNKEELPKAKRFNANRLLNKMQYFAVINGFTIKQIEVSNKDYDHIPDFVGTYGDNSVEVIKK